MILPDSSIRQNGIAENNIFTSWAAIPILLAQNYSTVSEIDISEISFAHGRLAQPSTIEVSLSQIGFVQGSLNHIGIFQVSPTQIISNHDGITHTNSFQFGFTEIGTL